MSDDALTPRERVMLAVDAKVEQAINMDYLIDMPFPASPYESAIERAALAVIAAISLLGVGER